MARDIYEIIDDGIKLAYELEVWITNNPREECEFEADAISGAQFIQWAYNSRMRRGDDPNIVREEYEQMTIKFERANERKKVDNG